MQSVFFSKALQLFFHFSLSTEALRLLLWNRCPKLVDEFRAVKNLEFRFQNSHLYMPSLTTVIPEYQAFFPGTLFIPRLEDLEVALPKGRWIDQIASQGPLFIAFWFEYIWDYICIRLLELP